MMSGEVSDGVPKADAYGGVLVSRRRKVLLIEPAGHFGGYAWTFPKGRPDQGEVPVDAALREVLEETGYRAEVLEPIPAVFPGTTSTTAYFIMGPLGRQGTWDVETATTRWVDVDEAERLIGQTATKFGRARDLAVLDAARAFLDRGEWSRRPATCREDWQVSPLPERRTTLALDHAFDAAAALRIRKGWFPAAMEERWFTWWEEPVLHMHRSWTGFGQYEVTLRPDGDGLHAVSALASRDPRQYTETDDEEDRRSLLSVLNALFVEAPDGPTTDPFAAAFALAAQPNYLGSPAVVSPLLGQVFDVAVEFAKGEADFNGCWNTMWELAQEVGAGSEYTRVPGWHTPEQLGRHLAKRFDLWIEESLADDLGYFISEAFAALFIKIRDMVLAFAADPHAEWERDALPQLNALHAWATAVLLGTDIVSHPGRTLSDFTWARVAPSDLTA